MKSILAATGILALAALFTSAVSIGEMPQDPPRGKKGTQHIWLMKIDDEGNKTELDTVLKAGQIFVWNGDTIGNGKDFNWTMKAGEFVVNPDMDFDFDIKDSGNGKMFVMGSGDSTKQIHINMLTDNDMDVTKWYGDKDMFFARSPASKMVMMNKRKNGNVIDLSAPGVISFEKKELKDGREKITIVREKPSEEEGADDAFMMPGMPVGAMFQNGFPYKAKTFKVITGNDGKLEIMEDGKLVHVDKMDGDMKVIEKDGKKIIIKKSKKDDEVKVNVEIEELEEGK